MASAQELSAVGWTAGFYRNRYGSTASDIGDSAKSRSASASFGGEALRTLIRRTGEVMNVVLIAARAQLKLRPTRRPLQHKEERQSSRFLPYGKNAPPFGVGTSLFAS